MELSEKYPEELRAALAALDGQEKNGWWSFGGQGIFSGFRDYQFKQMFFTQRGEPRLMTGALINSDAPDSPKLEMWHIDSPGNGLDGPMITARFGEMEGLPSCWVTFEPAAMAERRASKVEVSFGLSDERAWVAFGYPSFNFQTQARCGGTRRAPMEKAARQGVDFIRDFVREVNVDAFPLAHETGLRSLITAARGSLARESDVQLSLGLSPETPAAKLAGLRSF